MIGDLWIYKHDLPHVLLKLPDEGGIEGVYDSNRGQSVPPWSGMIVVEEMEKKGITWYRVSGAGAVGWIMNKWLAKRARRECGVIDI